MGVRRAWMLALALFVLFSGTLGFAQVVSIGAGRDETVFVSEAGFAYESSTRTVPTHLWWTFDLVSVSAGYVHYIALDSLGQVSTWGSPILSTLDYGQYGIPRSSDGNLRRVDRVEFPDDEKVLSIAAGEHFSMALTVSGRVYAWGRNNKGQLGDGTTQDRHEPRLVAGLEGVKVVAIAAGKKHALAMTSDGSVFAWGDNDQGQLGNGTYEGVFTNPQRVTIDGRLPMSGVRAIASSAHSDHSLAIVGNNRRVLAWGANSHAQLGTGSRANTAWGEYVFGLAGVSQVATGESSSYALLENGRVYAWSSNEYGKLGDGSGRHQPGATLVDALRDVRFIAAGQHQAFAVGENGTVWAWGSNSDGQLGTGDTTSRGLPTVIRGFWVHD